MAVLPATRKTAMIRDPEAPKLIEVAVAIIGSKERVREVMSCSEDAFRSYELGEHEIPVEELSSLIDVIVKEQHKLIEKRRAALAKLRQLPPESPDR
jgi:hypothetical protein